ncbi:hypothetical protein KUV85_07905 [Nocardioides panacisoli]|uniref:hypothetical protein n=1 Tax=Nocardioides panacisoli TaxID=627624 RepID=UPI001C637D3D|nr:hypothetical protein [Nocardioides panacisoli]QYJ05589.1 hypothetical protein KUV85_07905 [Nocardioides panacisoli]
MTLRDELGVRPDPEFDLDLPDGWARHGVDEESLQGLLAAVRRRCMDAHKPDLYAEMRLQMEEAFANMRRGGVFAYFCPSDPDPGTLAIPASINASVRRAEPGQSLDDLARTLIRQHGATPLLGDKRTLRCERERTSRLGTETLVHHSVVYLTPIPGAKRRRALSLVAGFARAPEVPTDAESIEATRFLFDACISTLRWRAPVTA